VQSVGKAKVVTHWFITPQQEKCYATDTCYHRNGACGQRGNVDCGICAKSEN
jgi:hypothetical protein